MAVFSGCATVWAGPQRPSTGTEDLAMSDWWTITVTVTAAMLIGKAMSWGSTWLQQGI
jgi:hypothetical protein